MTLRGKSEAVDKREFKRSSIGRLIFRAPIPVEGIRDILQYRGYVQEVRYVPWGRLLDPSR